MHDCLIIEFGTILSMVGEVVRVALPARTADDAHGSRHGDLAVMREGTGTPRRAKVVKLDPDVASIQVFGGAQGVSAHTRVRILGHQPHVAVTDNILVRVFVGDASAGRRAAIRDWTPFGQSSTPHARLAHDPHGRADDRCHRRLRTYRPRPCD